MTLHQLLHGRPTRARCISSFLTALGISLLASGCDEDSAPLATADPICDRFEVVRSVDYAVSQFFRLTAPVSFYFTNPDSFPRSLQDQSFAEVRSEQNPGAPWKIDYASLRVYRTMGAGVSDIDTIDGAVAYLDETGIGFEGFGSGRNLTPGDSGPTSGDPLDSGFDPTTALANLPQQYRERWERLRAPEEWSVFEVRGQILGIWLSSPAKDDDVIAVSYDIVDAGTGEVVRRVGRSSEDGEDGRIIDPNDPRRTINYFKLLKPGGPTSQPFSRLLNDYTEFALTWEYEYRNCYDLRGREIDAEQLVFRIVSSDATLDPPDRTPADIDPARTPFVRVFGLDRQARTGVLKPDGLADIEDQGVFNLRAGYVRFPHVTPMDLPDEVVEEYTGGALPSLPGSMRAPAIYTRRLTAAESAALNGFYFEIEWKE